MNIQAERESEMALIKAAFHQRISAKCAVIVALSIRLSVAFAAVGTKCSRSRRNDHDSDR